MAVRSTITGRVELASRFIVAFLLVAALVVGGSLGYMVLEGWSFLDSLYMTMITVATVGFQEVHHLSPEGRVFTTLLIIGGVGTVAYSFSTLTRFVVEGEFQAIYGRRKMEKAVANLKDHYIICGFGRMGSLLCKTLVKEGRPFVVIEQDRETLEELSSKGYLYVDGDATRDEVLELAGIHRARGLVGVLPSDADNVYITLTATALNPKIYILCRAESDSTESKLERAGADKVVSPYNIGGVRMAMALLRPAVVDFMEMASSGREMDIHMEQFVARSECEVSGKTLMDSGIRKKLGLIIISVKPSDGEMIFNPSPDYRIQPGDTLIAMGDTANLDRLAEMLGDKARE